MVAATYFYFLLFAEFALLEHAQSLLGLSPASLRPVLLGLGSGGVAGSVLAGWIRRPGLQATWWLAVGFVASAVAAGLVRLATSGPAFAAAAGAVGLGLGFLTVTLAANLRHWVPADALGRVIGAGTGLAYALSNVPAVFRAPTGDQILWAAAAMAWGAAVAARRPAATTASAAVRASTTLSWARWILLFLVLVWLDSAAFYVIQHASPLRSVTWEGSGRLWANAGLHLAGGLVAGVALDRGHLRWVLAAGAATLATGCAALAIGATWAGRVSLLYPLGVSLYSAALVYVPARLGTPRQIAALYAVSGWLGSALGIGLAQDLHQVPLVFIVVTGALVLVLLAVPPRAGWVWLLPCLFGRPPLSPIAAAQAAPDSLVARGREVYIAEGCMHCHSQFVRPGTSDVARWGPASSVDTIRSEQPPLLGNRRQGPDLAHVGQRRTPEWNRLHLMAPRALAPASRMPSYAHLFRDGSAERSSSGEAVVAYLDSLRPAGSHASAAVELSPAAPEAEPTGTALPHAQVQRLFRTWCAACHGPGGRGDGPLAAQLSLPPPDFTRDAWRRVPAGQDPLPILRHLIERGIPGSPMAGHEYLRPEEVRGLAETIVGLHAGATVHENPGRGR